MYVSAEVTYVWEWEIGKGVETAQRCKRKGRRTKLTRARSRTKCV
jgi:hypothetical protein